MTDWWTIIVAAYAAIVSTGALALEVRRWLESGPRLTIAIRPEVQMVPPIGGNADRMYLAAGVTNRGTSPTTILNFGLFDYNNRLDQLRGKHSWAGIVKPGPYTTIPATLPAGEVWTGLAPHDEALRKRIDTGQLHVAIYVSHKNKPVFKRVPRPPKPPESAEEV